MLWLLLFAVLVTTIVLFGRNAKPPKDPNLKCPICKNSASVEMAGGFHTCDSCGSSFDRREMWVSRAKCKHCNSRVVLIAQDPYTPGLFRLTFKCGRVVRFKAGRESISDSKCPLKGVMEEGYSIEADF